MFTHQTENNKYSRASVNDAQQNTAITKNVHFEHDIVTDLYPTDQIPVH